MGIAHFVQAAMILTLSQTVDTMKTFKFPLVTHYLKWDVGGFPELDTQDRFKFPLAVAASSFSFLSALFHGIVIMNFDTYTHDLRRGINKFRWYEYALSSSVMIALISMLFGVYDIMNLINIVGINACMNLFGLLFEVMNANSREAGKDEVDWSAFKFGSFAGIFPWIGIYVPIFFSENLDQIPSFVWGILASYFLFFNSFPINMYMQYNQLGKWNDALYPDMENGGYYYGEKVY